MRGVFNISFYLLRIPASTLHDKIFFAITVLFSTIKNEHRDQFYMIFLYDTETRDSELLNLRLRDIVVDAGAPYIIIRGKGKKIRSVPIMAETVRHFKSYIKRFHKIADPDAPMFYTVRDTPANTSYV